MTKPPTIKEMEREFDNKFTFCGDPIKIIEFNRRFKIDNKEGYKKRSKNRLVNIKSFYRHHIEEILEYLGMEEKPTTSVRELTLEEWSKELNSEIGQEVLEEKYRQLIKNEGYNQAIKKLNAKIKKVKKQLSVNIR